MNFEEELTKKVQQTEELLRRFLPREEGFQKTVLQAMNYSVLGGGKRLRPLLMREVFYHCGGENEAILEPFMAALEMIHTYSLVHDDLPAMDNDDYRRGRKTTHVIYGEDMAILAGDGLLNYAFETAMKAFDGASETEYPRVISALRVLAGKAGVYGMIGGQVCDVESENSQEAISAEKLLFIHEHKTAALIEAAMMIGGILAGAGEKTVRDLEKAAYNIGIAFQIQDDVLDVTGSEEVLGKPIGSDERNGKQTYVSIYGLQRSVEDVERLSREAIELMKLTEDSFVYELIIWLIHREK
ncbi:MAG: polyprenyl synthetase family protein [Lachnospiraceae bacterium]|nr:polyprenyl synthetase family protein [Lachnospiraceae bacterium]